MSNTVVVARGLKIKKQHDAGSETLQRPGGARKGLPPVVVILGGDSVPHNAQQPSGPLRQLQRLKHRDWDRFDSEPSRLSRPSPTRQQHHGINKSLPPIHHSSEPMISTHDNSSPTRGHDGGAVALVKKNLECRPMLNKSSKLSERRSKITSSPQRDYSVDNNHVVYYSLPLPEQLLPLDDAPEDIKRYIALLRDDHPLSSQANGSSPTVNCNSSSMMMMYSFARLRFQ